MSTFTLKIYEPFAITHKIVQQAVDGRTLGPLLDELGLAVSYCIIDHRLYEDDWRVYQPQKADVVAVFPRVGEKTFSSDYIAKLNANHSGGIFIKAVDVVENPVGPVVRRFVSHHESIVFDGQTYDPVHMEWSGLEVQRGMSLPQMGVAVPAAQDIVMDWAETIDIRENDITFRLLHLDLLGDTTAQDQLLMQVQTVTADDLVVVFQSGLNLGLTDELPRGVILKQEYPGIPEGPQRILV